MAYTINAHAKINLGLDVIRKRPDGYHDLRMIMQTIGLHDTLTFEVSDGDTVTMTCSNPELECDERNLVVKAVSLIADRYGIHKNINIHLEKNIPVAAGMAGGSTDGAAALIAMNDIFRLGLTKEELMRYGVMLGADIPFCILGGTALSEGIGDILTPIDAPAAAHILIAKPQAGVSTGFVYGNLRLNEDTVHPDIDAIIKALPESTTRTGILLGNILESVTIPAYPVIDSLKNCMLENGAAGSLMSGSGPTVFGIFDDKKDAEKALKECIKLDSSIYSCITEYYNP